MAIRIRNSKALKQLQQRNAKVLTINPKYDLGNGIDAPNVGKQVDDLDSTLAKYNGHLTAASGLAARITLLEAAARTTNRLLLKGVEAKYGGDSEQYQQAGGVRRSNIKRARGVKKALRAQQEQEAATPVAPAPSSSTTGGATNGTASNGTATNGAASNGVANGTSIHS